jgi:PPM family protein phosphatase
MGTMKLDIGYHTDTGLQRDHNEDAFGTRMPEAAEALDSHGALLAVADGMGGHLAGEVASSMAIQTLMDEFERSAGDPAEGLRAAIQMANRSVWEAGQADPNRYNMGTTLVAAVLRPGRLVVAHVGDSPAFLVRECAPIRLTRDHSWVEEAIERGHLDPSQAARHPYRHVLTRALGSLPEVDVEISHEVELQAGDTLVLCSDGLVRHVGESEIAELVCAADSAAGAARTLVDLANQRGGEDNTTVVVCKVAR